MSKQQIDEATLRQAEKNAGGAGAENAPAPALPVREDKTERIARYAVLLMKVGFLPSVILFASAFVLAAMGLLKEGAALAGLSVLSLFTIWVLSALSRSRLGISSARLRTYQLSAFSGTPATNGMLVPLFLRRLPLIWGVLTAVIAAVIGVLLKLPTVEVVSGALSALCSAVTLGIGSTAAIAMTGGVVRLQQSGIVVDDHCKIGMVARANVLLADKSVFRIESGAELKGLFFCGDHVRLSDLELRRHFPLVLGLTICDDGSLSREYGFLRENISDALLRIMHVSPPEYEMIHRFSWTAPPKFDRELGYAQGAAVIPEGVLDYIAGAPKKILPHIKRIYAPEGVRTVADGDRGLLKVTLRNAYSNGFSVIALAAGKEEEGLTFIGYAFSATELVPDTALSVAELERNGVRVIEASDENENAAFHEAYRAGVAEHMGQVLSREKIDRFSTAGAGRAISVFKVAAEVDGPRRAVLVRLLKGRKKLTVAASRDARDGLLPDADISVGASVDAKTDAYIKNCRISDVAEFIRISRGVCARAYKSAAYLLCVSLCAVFCAAASLAFAGRVPFAPHAAVVLTLLLPVLQAVSCALGGGTKSEINYKIAPGAQGRGIGRLPDRAFPVILIIYAFYAGVVSAAMFEKYGSGHAFLTLGLLMLGGGMICRVWGKTLMMASSYGGKGFLLSTFFSGAILLPLVLVPRAAAFFALEGFSYRNLPSAVLPALVPIVLYEICRLAINSARVKTKDGYGKGI